MDDHPSGSPQGPGGQNPAYRPTRLMEQLDEVELDVLRRMANTAAEARAGR